MPEPAEAQRTAQQYYLFQFSYTPTAWAALVKTPSDRVKDLDKLVKAFGGCFARITFPCDSRDDGTLNGKFISFGDRDVVALLAFPDDKAAAGFAMTIGAGHAVTSMKTTKLLSWNEAMSAMTTAGGHVSKYTPPK